jgi:hypothetical protein
LSPLLYHYERGCVVANTSTGILSLAGMVRIDTLPEPLPHNIDDVGLRAASLARGEEAVAMIEADGWHLIDPSLTLKWGEAATWPPAGLGSTAGAMAATHPQGHHGRCLDPDLALRPTMIYKTPPSAMSPSEVG